MKIAACTDSTQLAHLHARCFAQGWTRKTFAELLSQSGVCAFGHAGGFILLRHVLDEAEIFTLAVLPALRRQKLATQLVAAACDYLCHHRVAMVHLEVAQSNVAARNFYRQCGFVECGRRRGYYKTNDKNDDAYLMRRDLSLYLC